MSASMTSAPEMQACGAETAISRLPRIVLIALLGLLSACGPRQVIVEGSFPTPLMDPLPLTMGVWYNEEFSNHEFFDEAKGRADSTWIVKTGEAQTQMWDIVLGGMFRELVHMKGAPAPDQLNQVVDAVLIPHVEELQYAIPAHTNVKVYEIWMRYRFDMVTTAGEPIGSWTMSSYGKTPTAFLQSDEAAVNLAAVVALRDAGANFISNFSRLPAVKEWREQRQDSGASEPAGDEPAAATEAPATESEVVES